LRPPGIAGRQAGYSEAEAGRQAQRGRQAGRQAGRQEQRGRQKKIKNNKRKNDCITASIVVSCVINMYMDGKTNKNQSIFFVPESFYFLSMEQHKTIYEKFF
jgi:hypothetical protein